MERELPSRLVDCIGRTPIVNHRKISAERLELYAQAPSEHFNAVVADQVSIFRSQYGFEPCEHSDWVFPARQYKKKREGKPDVIQVLNSWMMKEPITYVPTLKHLKEEFDWLAEYSYSAGSANKKINTPEVLQEMYILRVCDELHEFVEHLRDWREVGMPREQSECFTGLSRSQIKSTRTYQKHNVLSAKQAEEKVVALYAPRFVAVATKAAHAKEVVIYDQLGEAMRNC
jgi:hypothetical protein